MSQKNQPFCQLLIFFCIMDSTLFTPAGIPLIDVQHKLINFPTIPQYTKLPGGDIFHSPSLRSVYIFVTAPFSVRTAISAIPLYEIYCRLTSRENDYNQIYCKRRPCCITQASFHYPYTIF